jgi:hypothetical protein
MYASYPRKQCVNINHPTQRHELNEKGELLSCHELGCHCRAQEDDQMYWKWKKKESPKMSTSSRDRPG